MLMLEFKELDWWYWLTTLIALSTTISDISDSFFPVIIISVIQLCHFIVINRGLFTFAVQVRITFLLYSLRAYQDGQQ